MLDSNSPYIGIENRGILLPSYVGAVRVWFQNGEGGGRKRLDYLEVLRDCRKFTDIVPQVLFLAPHSRNIEPGTGAIVDHLAEQTGCVAYRLVYAQTDQAWDQAHIGSCTLGQNKDKFPVLSKLQTLMPKSVISIHGHGRGDGKAYVGGAAGAGLLGDLSICLNELYGHRVRFVHGEEVPEILRGLSPHNITNCAVQGSRGIQIELPWSMRTVVDQRDEFVRHLITSLTILDIL